jgi:hypothetical protein
MERHDSSDLVEAAVEAAAEPTRRHRRHRRLGPAYPPELGRRDRISRSPRPHRFPCFNRLARCPHLAHCPHPPSFGLGRFGGSARLAVRRAVALAAPAARAVQGGQAEPRAPEARVHHRGPRRRRRRSRRRRLGHSFGRPS